MISAPVRLKSSASQVCAPDEKYSTPPKVKVPVVLLPTVILAAPAAESVPIAARVILPVFPPPPSSVVLISSADKAFEVPTAPCITTAPPEVLIVKLRAVESELIVPLKSTLSPEC